MKKQIGINMIANLVSFVVGMGINFFFTPYLINTVGIETYSFLPMTSNITSYFAIIATALNSMAARFVTIEIHKNDDKQANVLFNTVLFSNVVLGIFFSMVFTIIVIFLDRFLKIPVNVIFNIKTLFAITFFASILTLFATVFEISTFAKNRLELRSMTSITESTLRVFLLIGLFYFFVPNIVFVSLASLITAIVKGVLNFIYTKKLLPQIVISKSFFDIKAVKKLVSAGVWNSIAQSSGILMTGFDLILANMFLSATISGNIAISKTIPGLMYNISFILVGAFAPQFTILYAKKQNDELLKSVFTSLKILTMILSVPLAIVVVFGMDFYKLWIPKQDYQVVYILTILTLIPTFISAFVLPLNNIYAVVNKLKYPVLFKLILGIINLVIVLILLNLIPSYGMYIITGTSGLLLLCDYLFFLPMYSAKCLDLKYTTFYKHILKSVFSTAFMILVFYSIKSFVPINSWFQFFVVAIFCGILGLTLNFLILTNKNEKKYLLGVIKSKFVAKKI